MTITSAEKRKDISLELMRVIALFFVIFNHTGTDGFILFTKYKIGSFYFWLYMPWSVVCTFSVPLFFMISGITLLKKKEPLSVLFRKRILRNLLVLLFISVVYYVKDVLSFPQISVFDICITFVRKIFCGDISVHLHFMYKYLVFLIALPFLRVIIQHISKKEFHYIFITAFSFRILEPLFINLLSNGASLQDDLYYLKLGFVVYPFLGYYLYYMVDLSTLRRKHIIGIVLLTVTALFFTCFLHIYSPIPDKRLHMMFVWIYSTAVFILIRYYFLNITNLFLQKIILSLGSCVFGAYLIHMLVMHFAWAENMRLFLTSHLSPLTAILLFCLLIMTICISITFILKKIPLLNKLL